MKFHTKIRRRSPFLALVAAIFFAQFSTSAYAITCDSKSANFASMGERYFEFDAVPELTDQDEKTVRNFVKKLDRKLRFKVEQIVCVGVGKNARKLMRRGTGHAVLKSSSLYPLIIQMEIEYEKKIQLTSLELLALDSVFNFNITKNTISAEHFYRNRGVFHERVYEVTKHLSLIHI